MGMAASQARLLTLTARKSDLEFRAQQITNSEMILAMQTEVAAKEYSNAMSNTKYQVNTYTSDSDKKTVWADMTAEQLFGVMGYGMRSDNGEKITLENYEELLANGDSMAQKIQQSGMVVKDENGYTIVAGERRWRAAKNAGLKEIPAIIKDYTDGKKKQVALIENIQREDLNIIEVARAIKELMEIDGYSQSEVSRITGKSLSTVSNIMRLLKLPDKILDYVLEGKLVEGQARALLALDDEKKQIAIAEKIIEKKLTVREVEKLIYGAAEYKRSGNKKQPKTIYYQKIEEKLKNYFGYKVKIDSSKKHQKLVIEYNDEEGLESLLSKLNIKM